MKIRSSTHNRKQLRAACLFLTVLFVVIPCGTGTAQEVVDKTVALINGSELITYSDLIWQLALQPDTPLDDPRSADLQAAL